VTAELTPRAIASNAATVTATGELLPALEPGEVLAFVAAAANQLTTNGTFHFADPGDGGDGVDNGDGGHDGDDGDGGDGAGRGNDDGGGRGTGGGGEFGGGGDGPSGGAGAGGDGGNGGAGDGGGMEAPPPIEAGGAEARP